MLTRWKCDNIKWAFWWRPKPLPSRRLWMDESKALPSQIQGFSDYRCSHSGRNMNWLTKAGFSAQVQFSLLTRFPLTCLSRRAQLHWSVPHDTDWHTGDNLVRMRAAWVLPKASRVGGGSHHHHAELQSAFEAFLAQLIATEKVGVRRHMIGCELSVREHADL